MVLGSLALFGACRASAGIAPEAKAAGARTLVIASDLGNAPFAWVAGEEQGAGTPAAWALPRKGEGGIAVGSPLAVGKADRALGRDVEMSEQLAAFLADEDGVAVELVWRRTAFDELLPALEASEADLVVATLGWTAERAERVALSQPYFRTSIEAVVRIGDGEPRTMADLAGRKVSAGLGTTSEFAVRTQVPAAVLRGSDDKGETGITGLLAGDLDALVMDGPDARDLVAAHPGEVRLLDAPLAREDYVIAVAPARADELLPLVDRFLAEHADALRSLDARYGL